MIWSQFRLRDQVRPSIRGESRVTRKDDSDEVVFGSAYSMLYRERTVVVREGVLKRQIVRAKEGSKFRQGLIACQS